MLKLLAAVLVMVSVAAHARPTYTPHLSFSAPTALAHGLPWHAGSPGPVIAFYAKKVF